MDKDVIINKWRIGFTVKQISKYYMVQSNKKTEKKITLREAQAYVEPIIFNYQTGLLKGIGKEC